MDLNIIKLKNKIFYYNNLYHDYIFDFEKVRSFFTYDYRKVESYKARMEYLQRTYDRKLKESFSEDIFRYNQSIGCGKKTLDNIEIFRQKKSFAVVTGQQPAIFGGPLFTIYKTISLISLARFLSNKFDINVIPIFWNASDDNDIDEIKSINIISGDAERVSIDIPEYLSRLSYSKIILPVDEYENLIRKMLDSLTQTEYKKDIEIFFYEILEKVIGENRSSGYSVSKFFSVILTKLFSKYGLVILDPELISLKKLSRKIIDFDIAKQKEIHGMIDFNSKELLSLGYHNQLNLIRDNLDFFLNSKSAREKIKINDDGTFYIQGIDNKKNYISENELKDILFKNISDVALNVITRPLLQDWILPNIATISGPGEISYFAQIKDIYTFFGIEMPIIVPRLSATVVEDKIKKPIEKIKLDYENLELFPDKQTKSILKNMIGFDINTFLLDLEEELFSILNKKKEILHIHELDNDGSFNRIYNNLKKEIDILGKRILSEYRKKNSLVVDSINKIYNNILPNGNLQERFANIFDYVNRYGFGLIDSLCKNNFVFDFMHRFIEIK